MKKTVIVHGKLNNELQKRALRELTTVLLDYTLDYPVCAEYSESFNSESCRCIYIGTKESNLYIKNNSNAELSAPEAYSIEVKNDTAIIEGYDDAGVIYGVLDFYNKYISLMNFRSNHVWLKRRW